MKNVLVVFSGKAQSGKTTASNVLREIAKAQLPPNYDFDIHGPVKIFSFATALKKIAEEYFGWDGDKGIYYGDADKNDFTFETGDRIVIPDKGRQLLINIGQHMRVIRATVWVDYVINRIKAEGATGTNKVFIIDDLRMKNEISIVKEFQPCYSIRMNRSSQLNIDDISENDLDDAKFDYYVDNNENLDELKIRIKEIWDDICKNNAQQD
jgi:hypothetical protein